MAGRACINHPKRVTRVSCAACGDPICTACMRETPVGMKCPSCARPRLHAGARGRPKHYAMASGAGLAVAIAIGALATLPTSRAHLGILGILLPIIAGAVVGRAVAWGAQGHRHGRFVTIAVAVTVVGLVAGSVLAGASFQGAAGPAALFGLLLAAVAAGFVAGR